MSKKKNLKKNNSVNKTTTLPKVSGSNQREKDNSKNQVTKTRKKANSSRVQKNESLYNEGDLALTKQQKFNFDSYIFEDEMDTSFLEKKKRKQSDTNKLKNQLKKIEIQKKKYKISFIISFILLLFMCALSITIVYIHMTSEPKVVTKVKEKRIVDDNYLFLGDSLTHRYNLEKYYENIPVVNSGVEGDTAENILNNIKERVYDYNPSKIILLIGTNDLDSVYHLTPEDVFENIKKIIEGIKENRKYSKIYIESLYPLNKTLDSASIKEKSNDRIIELNQLLEAYCRENHYPYIDVYSKLTDEDGNLLEKYTEDGIHLVEEGYSVITEEIKKYIFE